MMPEEYEDMTAERKEHIKNSIMSVLFELYEDQKKVKYTWKEVRKEIRKEIRKDTP